MPEHGAVAKLCNLILVVYKLFFVFSYKIKRVSIEIQNNSSKNNLLKKCQKKKETFFCGDTNNDNEK